MLRALGHLLVRGAGELGYRGRDRALLDWIILIDRDKFSAEKAGRL